MTSDTLPPPPWDAASLAEVGTALHRPECVLTTPGGDLYVADWRGGVTHVRDGEETAILAREPAIELRPNGIALAPGGSFLLTNLGPDGGVWWLHRDRRLEPYLLEVDGVKLPPSNFVLIDSERRVWISVSTRLEPRSRAYRPGVADGFIVRVDPRGVCIVADGLAYTNELQIDPSGRWLYANETFGRRVSRFALDSRGELGRRQTVTELGPGSFPDGLCFDEEQALWITCPVGNRLLRITADGRQQTMVEDSDAAFVAEVEDAFQSGSMGRSHLDQQPGRHLRNLSSLAFGGADRRTGYLGCLLGSCLKTFRSPVPGVAPAHWEWS